MRRSTNFGLGAAALAVALFALFAPTAPASPQHEGHGGQHDAHMSDASKHMHDVMMKGMGDMKGMKMTGNADHDFATMMRHHHMHGVEMAEAYLKGAKDDQMRAMAQKIVDAQKKEIAEFDAWLAGHKMGASARGR
jgi:uncharacterized protein (DUF305 family)